MTLSAYSKPVFVGILLVVLYTLAVTLSDVFTKHLAANFEAPQVLLLCSGTVLAIIFGSRLRGGQGPLLKTACPIVMGLRSIMAVVAAVLFYYAFALLPFADVFLFIGMVPIFAALMSRLLLKESVSMLGWVAVLLGCGGVFMLFPSGFSAVDTGHLFALGASLAGTSAIVLARYIARVEQNPISLVFYPQLAVFVVMLCVAPVVWAPMSLLDIVACITCGGILFIARYALAAAMQVLPAHSATPLLNLQFVWMVVAGIVIFGEYPGVNTLVGAAIIICSGFLIVYQERRDALCKTEPTKGIVFRPPAANRVIPTAVRPRIGGDVKSPVVAPASKP